MNYQEFKARTNSAASYETFETFEKMYMAGNLDKDEFCKLVKPSVDAICRKEQKEAWNRQNRLVRVRRNLCKSGSYVFELCVKLGVDNDGAMILQHTGFNGLGWADSNSRQIRYKSGIAKLTQAEREEMELMDVWKNA